jgi:hypothetical protein
VLRRTHDRDPVHQAATGEIVEDSVHRRAVVPHEKVAFSPVVAVGEVLLDRVLKKKRKDGVAFLGR